MPRSVIELIISFDTDFRPTVRAPTTEKNRTGMIVGIVVGVGVAFLLVLAVFFIVKRRKKLQHDDEGETKYFIKLLQSMKQSQCSGF